MFKKHIFIKDKAITKKHSQNIVKRMDESPLDRSNRLPISHFYKALFNVNPYEEEWFSDFCKVIEEYKKINSFLGYGRGGPWETDPICNYQRYNPGQHYKLEHCEHGPLSPHRVLGWMFYCNTIKKGGGTSFPQQKLRVKARVGTMIIWPAAWTHSHVGIIAPHEYKYIVTGWCSWLKK